jgi:phosphate transport system substrate-binding protein
VVRLGVATCVVLLQVTPWSTSSNMGHPTAAAQEVTPPEYVATRQVAGVIHTCGSPQMGDLLKLYEQGFVKLQPSVRFDDQLTSTLTAVESVYSGRAEIGLLGREIWSMEAKAFEFSQGHPPTVIDVATGSYDVPKATFALMIFVPKSNPIASISTRQLERLFAASDRPIRTWGELGLKGNWTARPIHLYGFTVDNDKSQIFRQLVFSKAEGWNPSLRSFSNASGSNGTDAGELIVQAVANDPNAIGISNVHYATAGVKALAIAASDSATPIPPTRENVLDRTYPLTRAVYMVLDNDPREEQSTAVVEFLRYVLSRQGQLAVIREGNYLPLPAEVAQRQLQQLAKESR